MGVIVFDAKVKSLVDVMLCTGGPCGGDQGPAPYKLLVMRRYRRNCLGWTPAYAGPILGVERLGGDHPFRVPMEGRDWKLGLKCPGGHAQEVKYTGIGRGGAD